MKAPAMTRATAFARACLLGLGAIAIVVAPADAAPASSHSVRSGHQQGGQNRGLSSGRGHEGQGRHGHDGRRGAGNASLRVDGNRHEGLSGRHFESSRSSYRDHHGQRSQYERHRYDRSDHYYYRQHYQPVRHYARHPVYYRPPVYHYHPIYVSGLPYYYYSGYFYRPYSDSYWVRVVAPIGARVGVLPTGYISFGYGGSTYYYLNATWFLYDRPAREYVVVEPPPGVVSAGSTGSAGYAVAEYSDEVFVYPARGQSAEQTQRDRYECHLWAVSQTGVDPSMDQADDSERAEYHRALTACLEGRGYTVR